MKSKSKIAGILTTLLMAFAILLVSVFKSTSVDYVYSATPVPEKADNKDLVTVDYLLAYPGKINPDSALWYAKVVRDKTWYLFTFNPSKKRELNLLFADKRLSSSVTLFQNSKPDLGFSTLTKAEMYLEAAIPEKADDNEYLTKLALASLKHREVIENEILPLTPEDLRPKVIKLSNYSKETFKKVRDLMLSKGLVAPVNPFETN